MENSRVGPGSVSLAPVLRGPHEEPLEDFPCDVPPNLSQAKGPLLPLGFCSLNPSVSLFLHSPPFKYESLMHLS